MSNTLFHLPRSMNPSLHQNNAKNQPQKLPIINKDSGAHLGEGYCQAAGDAPLEADTIYLNFKMADRSPASIHIFHIWYPEMDLPTYCEEQSKLADYKPCPDMTDFLCRAVKPQASLGPNRYLYNPSLKIAGMPPILACHDNMRGKGQYCRVLIALAHDVRVHFSPRKSLAIGVEGSLASDDGLKIVAKLTELNRALQTIMPNIDAANTASICSKK